MEQTGLLRVVVVLLEGLPVPYAIVGSFASGAFGEPCVGIGMVVERNSFRSVPGAT